MNKEESAKRAALGKQFKTGAKVTLRNDAHGILFTVVGLTSQGNVAIRSLGGTMTQSVKPAMIEHVA